MQMNPPTIFSSPNRSYQYYYFHMSSNFHASGGCFQVPPRAMAGMSSADFVEEHLEDRTMNEVLDDPIIKQQVIDGIRVKEVKAKKEKKPVDPNKPKKTSGYLIYSGTIRAEVKEKLIADGGEGKPTEVIKAIAAKWKELNDEEKVVWTDKAKAIKEQVNIN